MDTTRDITGQIILKLKTQYCPLISFVLFFQAFYPGESLITSELHSSCAPSIKKLFRAFSDCPCMLYASNECTFTQIQMIRTIRTFQPLETPLEKAIHDERPHLRINPPFPQYIGCSPSPTIEKTCMNAP